MNKIEVDYDKMILNLFFQGVKHTFDLKQGDAGEFWHGFQHKNEEWDLNFYINSDGITVANIYSTIEDEEGFVSIDTEGFTINNVNIKEQGDKEKYLSYWWYDELKEEICKEKLL